MDKIEQVNPLFGNNQAKEKQSNIIQPDFSFESYLRAVNNRIDSKENKIISDYKSANIDRPKSYQDTPVRSDAVNNNRTRESYSERNNLSDRKSYNEFNDSSLSRRADISDSTPRRLDVKQDNNYRENYTVASNNQPNNNAVNNFKDDSKRSIEDKSADDTSKRILAENIILNPVATPKDNFATSSSQTLEDINDIQPADVALEDNFLLASLVYKLYSLIATTSATNPTENIVDDEAPSMKDVMDIVKSLPESEIEKLTKLLNVEEVGLSEKDKANLQAIKDILMANNKLTASLEKSLTMPLPNDIKNTTDKNETSDINANTNTNTNIDNTVSEVQTKTTTDRIYDLTMQTDLDKLITKQFEAQINAKTFDEAINNSGVNIDATAKDSKSDNKDNILAKLIANQDTAKDTKLEMQELGTIAKLLEKIRKEDYEEILRQIRSSKAVTDSDEQDKTRLTDNSKSLDNTISAKTLNQLSADTGLNLKDLTQLVEQFSKMIDANMTDKEILAVLQNTDENKVASADINGLKNNEKIQPTMDNIKKASYDDLTQKIELSKLMNNTQNQENSAKVIIDENIKVTKEVIDTKSSEVKPQSVKPEQLQDIAKIYDSLKVQVEKIIRNNSSSQPVAVNPDNANSSNLNQNNSGTNSGSQDSKNLLTSNIIKLATSSSNSANKMDNMLNDFNNLLKQQNELKFEGKDITQPRQTYDLKEPKDILRLVKSLEQAQVKGESKLTISLTPENLGKLEIRLAEVGGKLTAKFYTENESSHKMMLTQAEAIRNQLSDKGIVIDNMEFAFNDSSSKDNKPNDHKKSAKGNNNADKEDKDNVLERNNNLNFRSKAASRGLYA